MHNYVFNGDADGLCALQQLRLAGPRPAAGRRHSITGVKRDIALLDRVRSVAGDTCTVLDVSLDVNRAGLVALLAAAPRSTTSTTTSPVTSRPTRRSTRTSISAPTSAPA